MLTLHYMCAVCLTAVALCLDCVKVETDGLVQIGGGRRRLQHKHGGWGWGEICFDATD